MCRGANWIVVGCPGRFAYKERCGEGSVVPWHGGTATESSVPCMGVRFPLGCYLRTLCSFNAGVFDIFILLFSNLLII